MQETSHEKCALCDGCHTEGGTQRFGWMAETTKSEDRQLNKRNGGKRTRDDGQEWMSGIHYPCLHMGGSVVCRMTTDYK